MMLKRRPFLIRKMLIIVISGTQINVTASHFIIGVEVCSVIIQVKNGPAMLDKNFHLLYMYLHRP